MTARLYAQPPFQSMSIDKRNGRFVPDSVNRLSTGQGWRTLQRGHVEFAH